MNDGRRKLRDHLRLLEVGDGFTTHGSFGGETTSDSTMSGFVTLLTARVTDDVCIWFPIFDHLYLVAGM